VRTVFLGTSDFAVAVLERLAAGEHRPELVVTRPDRPKGRGRRVAPPPAAEAARRLGIDVIQPASVNDEQARGRIAEAAPDVVAIASYGGLIKEPLLSDYEMINVHPSLLPRWRGAAPIERAIMAGDAATGVTIMRPTAELDAGPMALQAVEPVSDDDDYGSLSARLAELGAGLLVRALDERPALEDQPPEGVTYADKLEASDRRLDPSRPAAELERRVRALTPHVGAYVELPGGDRLGVRRATVAAGDGGPAPGEVSGLDGRLLYGAADAPLELHEVQPAGRRAMDASSYLRGHAVQPTGQRE
jgi:methionyl-tRNA formyltransferase